MCAILQSGYNDPVVFKNEYELEDRLEAFTNKNFTGIFQYTTEESQKAIKLTMGACGLIRKIRRILNKEIYICTFGPQNAGKSTLLKTTWNIPTKCGIRVHTLIPEIWTMETDSGVKINIVDFPGELWARPV